MNLVFAVMVILSSGAGEIDGKEPPVRVFASEIASYDCVLRTFQSATAWYHVSAAVDGKEILLKCEEGSDGTGYLNDSWLLAGPEFPEPIELKLAGLGYFSNPSICGTKVAYWGKGENNSLNGVVAEFDHKQILAEVDLGVSPVETDFRFHYALPLWNESCKVVVFQLGDTTWEVNANDG